MTKLTNQEIEEEINLNDGNDEFIEDLFSYSNVNPNSRKTKDSFYRKDDGVNEFVAKTVSKIEGLPVAENVKRKLLVTSKCDMKTGHINDFLYELSDNKARLLAQGDSIALKDDLVVVSGNLYRLGEHNKMSYITSKVSELLGKGYFSMYPKRYKDTSGNVRFDPPFLCHTEGGKYKRLVSVSPHSGDCLGVINDNVVKFVDTWMNGFDADVSIYEIEFNDKKTSMKTIYHSNKMLYDYDMAERYWNYAGLPYHFSKDNPRYGSYSKDEDVKIIPEFEIEHSPREDEYKKNKQIILDQHFAVRHKAMMKNLPHEKTTFIADAAFSKIGKGYD